MYALDSFGFEHDTRLSLVIDNTRFNAGEDDERGSGRAQHLAQRFFDLSISLKQKAEYLYQLMSNGHQCFEKWERLERAAMRARWLWMAYEFDSKAKYLDLYNAAL